FTAPAQDFIAPGSGMVGVILPGARHRLRAKLSPGSKASMLSYIDLSVTGRKSCLFSRGRSDGAIILTGYS
ncbi:TPA: hypothetical protein MH325_24750, partial [Klebsiella pneumoniae]|nr:hypothetical protein [Klebsiella pneumoniae]